MNAKKKTLSLYSIILYTVICYPHNFIVSSIFVLLIASIPSFSVSLDPFVSPGDMSLVLRTCPSYLG